MNRTLIFGSSILLIAVLATLTAQMPNSPQSGLSGSAEAQVQKEVGKEKRLIIQGKLTSEGIECPTLRTDDGTLYTLNGHLKEFQVGDRVEVEGEIADISTCQQGITINVHRITGA